MSSDALADTYRCTKCGFLASRLPVAINHAAAIDEGARQVGLKTLRLSGYARILDAVKGILLPGSHLLDVGSAHGWFIEAAARRGYHAEGMEPDDEMAEIAESRGLPITRGYFPVDLESDKLYDAISFHDVFEHLPDVHGALQGVRDHLRPNGLLIINIPMSNGFIFSATRTAARLGLTRPLARMWQQGLPSPHLSYFSPTNLRDLVSQSGFDEILSDRLPTLELSGLKERIGYDKTMSPVAQIATYAVATVLSPILNFMPADIRFFVFRKKI